MDWENSQIMDQNVDMVWSVVVGVVAKALSLGFGTRI